jgi:hypothetical protein
VLLCCFVLRPGLSKEREESYERRPDAVYTKTKLQNYDVHSCALYTGSLDDCASERSDEEHCTEPLTAFAVQRGAYNSKSLRYSAIYGRSYTLIYH